MAHSIAVAAKRNHDEVYTPRYFVEAAFPYLNERLQAVQYNKHRTPIVLCPFDTEKSAFVQVFTEKGYEVKYGHIDTGQDFFNYDYGLWDACISNPPFSRKLDVFKYLDALRMPWAMVMNVMSLNYHEIINYFIDNPKELMFFNKRVSYDGNPSSFGSMFVCNDMLTSDVKFVNLSHNNTGKNFKPSEMYDEFRKK